MKCIVFGHSHMTTILPSADELNMAYQPQGLEFKFVQFPWLRSVHPAFRRVGDGTIILNDAILLELERAGLYEDDDIVLASVVAGNENHALTLLKHDDPFDVILPMRTDLPVSAQSVILPFQAFKEVLRQSVLLWWPLISELRRVTGRRVVQIETVPPIPDNSHIAEKLDPFFKRVTINPEISDRYLRYKAWLTLSEVVCELARADDVEYLTVPPSMLDHEGFLRREGWFNDATHGSVTYSAHVIHRLAGHLVGGRM
ncbi:hypothetical protein C6558_37890 [Ensifer sp. NM-2]|uniref:hypothetical protein n=1 Tax=Ensifer sp. NM-2 TaxID=2109730 RepID=UPI000D11E0B5|nr:hypothetical protein [Ensifer sp. NM-2]PSS59507.1 hypothetical protein C6558_37890 [Ensifer sp. NM-2]